MFSYTLHKVKNGHDSKWKWYFISKCVKLYKSASNTKHTILIWLPWEIMYCSYISHDYLWPWVSLMWLLYNLARWHPRCWFQKLTILFWPIRKEIVNGMYNNTNDYNSVWLWFWCDHIAIVNLVDPSDFLTHNMLLFILEG